MRCKYNALCFLEMLQYEHPSKNISILLHICMYVTVSMILCMYARMYERIMHAIYM